MRRTTVFFLLLFMSLTSYAQRVQVSAPRHVGIGQEFQVEYTISTENVRSFRLGSMPSGIEVLYGPSTSKQSSYQVINGHMSSNSLSTYSFVMVANRKGTFTLPPAHFTANGVSLASSPIRVVAVPPVQRAGSAGSYAYDDYDDEPEQRAPGKKSLFIRVTASKKRVHEQEPVLLTYKVYTTVNLTELEGKMPDLDGFHTQEVKLPQQKVFHTERVGGRTYNCVTWSQYVLYPQMTGQLRVPPITFHGIVMEENRNIDPFEAFVTGGGYKESRRDIQAPGLTITVDPLPAAPAGFSGGVGHFNLAVTADKKQLRAGDPISLHIVVSGIGNLKLIKQPVVTAPAGFDKYDPKVTDKTRLSANGVEGSMIYDVLLVPQQEGHYTIPPVTFTYFDTQTGAYRTLKSQPIAVEVAKGNGSATAINDYTSGDSRDIAPIIRGNVTLKQPTDMFFASPLYWLIIVVLVAGTAFVCYTMRRRIQQLADVAGTRRNNANRVATKRLHRADDLMNSGNQKEFYDEVLRALWGYVSDKLNLPVEQLSKENISDKLAALGIDSETIKKFLSALDECEFERYAPGDAKGNMHRTFEMAMTAIMNIENALKPKAKAPKTSMLLLLFLLLPAMAGAVTKQQADTEYALQRYQNAAADYEQLLRQGVAPEVYNNLGNCYFRLNDITKAVIAYERAWLLDPGNSTINHNLEVARAHTIDKIVPEEEMFFITWFRALVHATNVDGWALWSIIFLTVGLLLAMLSFFSSKQTLRSAGKVGATVMAVGFVFALTCASWQRHNIAVRSAAVVTAASISVKATPAASSADSFVLHEGTRVDISDDSMRGWYRISVADGREGWIQRGNVEVI